MPVRREHPADGVKFLNPDSQRIKIEKFRPHLHSVNDAENQSISHDLLDKMHLALVRRRSGCDPWRRDRG